MSQEGFSERFVCYAFLEKENCERQNVWTKAAGTEPVRCSSKNGSE
jgi:hypothetical protein